MHPQCERPRPSPPQQQPRPRLPLPPLACGTALLPYRQNPRPEQRRARLTGGTPPHSLDRGRARRCGRRPWRQGRRAGAPRRRWPSSASARSAAPPAWPPRAAPRSAPLPHAGAASSTPSSRSSGPAGGSGSPQGNAPFRIVRAQLSPLPAGPGASHEEI